MNDLDS